MGSDIGRCETYLKDLNGQSSKPIPGVFSVSAVVKEVPKPAGVVCLLNSAASAGIEGATPKPAGDVFSLNSEGSVGTEGVAIVERSLLGGAGASGRNTFINDGGTPLASVSL